MGNIRRRNALTVDQQEHQRANLMKSAGKVVKQLEQYITDGYIMVGGKQHTIDNTRLKAYQLVLDRTVPAMSSKEITHKNEYEGMDSGVILERLAKLVAKKPELAIRLQEALGGKVIQGEVLPASEAAHSDDSPQIDSQLDTLPNVMRSPDD